MAQVGQTTPTGTRSIAIFDAQAAMSRLTIPVGATVNYLGCYLYESITANENDLIAFIYNSSTAALIYTSNILANAITSTSIGAPYNAHVTFTGATLASGTYDFVICATGRGGTPIVSGQNGPGSTPVLLQRSNIYGAPPDPYTLGTVDSTATRTWDIYVDYTAGGGSSIAAIAGAYRLSQMNNI